MSDRTDFAESTGAAPNLFQSVLRRWPLLLIGAVAGGVVGFLGYASQPPTYQSTAQIQVIKRDTARGVNDLRQGYIDDYVANQLELLKSQHILIAASRSSKIQEASPQFVEQLKGDEMVAYGLIRNNLNVTRSKETALGPVGNSIVNLSFTAGDPRDSQTALSAIIDTYKMELSKVSSDSMKERVTRLEKHISELEEMRITSYNEKVRATDTRLKITPEPPETLTQRWTNQKGELFKIKSELYKVDDELDAISKSGKNRSDRAVLFSMLTGTRRGGDPTTSQYDREKMILELRKEQIAKTYGRDHPLMQEVVGQLKLVDKELDRINPDKSGDLDDLGLYKLRLDQTKKTLEKQKSDLEETIKKDFLDLEELRPLQTLMAKYDDEVRSREKQIFERRTELGEALATQRAAQTEAYEARVNNPPRAGAKVGPVLMLWLTPGIMLGSLVGGGLALLLEMRDKSFRNPAEIRARLGVPILGHLPTIRLELPREGDVSPDYDPSLVTAVRPKSVESEAYRGVRAQVMQMFENQHAVVQVTSPTPGDGKSTLAANLAISLAQSGKKTILLDCDFRKPRVHKLFAITKPEVGLASVTSGDTDLTDAIRHSDVDRLDLLPCGPRPANPAELLSGGRFQEVLKELKGMYDFVIVDTPPLLAVSDPRVVAQRVDGVVLVFRITNKVRPLAERAREYLSDMGANLLGVAVNGGGKGDEYGYGYGYSYAYDYDYDYEYAETYNTTEEKSKF